MGRLLAWNPVKQAQSIESGHCVARSETKNPFTDTTKHNATLHSRCISPCVVRQRRFAAHQQNRKKRRSATCLSSTMITINETAPLNASSCRTDTMQSCRPWNDIKSSGAFWSTIMAETSERNASAFEEVSWSSISKLFNCHTFFRPHNRDR